MQFASTISYWWSGMRRQLDRIEDKLTHIERTQETIMAAIDDLETKVAAEETVVQSAVTLLTELNTELKAALAAGDTARIEALSAKIDTDTQALAAAVSANTPAAPAPAA